MKTHRLVTKFSQSKATQRSVHVTPWRRQFGEQTAEKLSCTAIGKHTGYTDTSSTNTTFALGRHSLTAACALLRWPLPPARIKMFFTRATKCNPIVLSPSPIDELQAAYACACERRDVSRPCVGVPSLGLARSLSRRHRAPNYDRTFL